MGPRSGQNGIPTEDRGNERNSAGPCLTFATLNTSTVWITHPDAFAEVPNVYVLCNGTAAPVRFAPASAFAPARCVPRYRTGTPCGRLSPEPPAPAGPSTPAQIFSNRSPDGARQWADWDGCGRQERPLNPRPGAPTGERLQKTRLANLGGELGFPPVFWVESLRFDKRTGEFNGNDASLHPSLPT